MTTFNTADAAAAARADVTIAVIGLSVIDESESHDRTSFELPGHQLQLVRTVAAASRGPLVLVVFSGGMVDLTPVLDLADAVLWAGYPGQSGGEAIARLLYGIDEANPSGRLPLTMLPAAYVNQSDFLDMNMRAKPGQTYRFYTGKPVFPFGHGLTYSNVTYAWSSTPSRRVLAAADVAYSVVVTNHGPRAGDEVVLAFISRPDGADGPVKQLFAFERIHLAAGESKTVHLLPSVRDLSLVDASGRAVLTPGRVRVTVGVPSGGAFLEHTSLFGRASPTQFVRAAVVSMLKR